MLQDSKDHSFEDRFDPKYKTIFAQKLAEFDQILNSQRKYDFDYRLVFKGKFDKKIENALKKIVKNIFQFSIDFELYLNRFENEIHILTESEWLTIYDRTPAENLPAAHLEKENNTTIVKIVIPDVIESGSAVINIARLICSKFFGKVYFQQHVPQFSPFDKLNALEEQKNFEAMEKARFLRLRNEFTKELQGIFARLGKAFKIVGEQRINVGKNEFFKEIFQNKNETYLKVLENEFGDQIHQLEKNFESTIQSFLKTLNLAISQTNLFLPHELPTLNSLKEKSLPIYLERVLDRVEFLTHFIEEIGDTQEKLEKISTLGSEDLEAVKDQLSSLRLSLKYRMTDIKREGLVKLFLIENQKRKTKDLIAAQQFPLWIHEHVEFDPNYQKRKDKWIKKITEKYKHSVYNKLFEGSFRQTEAISEILEQELPFSQSTHAKALKTIFAWLKFRSESIYDLKSFVQVLLYVSKRNDPKLKRIQTTYDHFDSAWSYFISYALIHQYYLKVGQKSSEADTRAFRYEQVIEDYISKKMNRSDSFKIAAVFFLIYRKADFQIEAALELIKKHNDTFEFFLLEQKQIFSSETPVWKVCERYAQMVLSMHQNRKAFASFPQKSPSIIDLN